MADKRPMPDDFAIFASTHSRRETEQHYQCGNVTASRWYAEAGVQTPRAQVAKIPVTAIAKVRKLVAAGESASAIGALYNASKKATLGFVEKHNLGPWPIIRTRSLPEDFLTEATKLARDAAKRRWGCSNDTLARWYAETGIVAAKRASTRINATPDKIAKVTGLNIKEAAETLGINRKAAGRMMREAGLWEGRKTKENAQKPVTDNAWKFRKPAGAPPMPMNFYVRDMSPTGLAKDCLQRDRWTVFRCDLHGHPMADGLFWKCGNAICTDGELLNRADRAARRMGEVVTWRGRIAA